MKLVLDGGDVVPDPKWDEVEDLIRCMDGDQHSFLAMDTEHEDSLLVAGGNDGRYLVVHMTNSENQTSTTLADSSLGGPDVGLSVEGVYSEYPAQFGIGRELALMVARSYFETKKLPAGLEWRDSQAEKGRRHR